MARILEPVMEVEGIIREVVEAGASLHEACVYCNMLGYTTGICAQARKRYLQSESQQRK